MSPTYPSGSIVKEECFGNIPLGYDTEKFNEKCETVGG